MAEMLSYKTLREENSAEFIINKSRFIGYGCPCKTEEEALAFLSRIRQKHKDATHNCSPTSSGSIPASCATATTESPAERPACRSSK